MPGRLEAPHLSVALPCFNEQGNIARTVADITEWLDLQDFEGEIVAVDDGSTDRTHDLLVALARSEPRLRVVKHERNLGYGQAVRSGLDACRGDWIAFMDSDGQFRAGDLSRLLQRTHDAEVVVGRRHQRADPWFRRANARCFRLLNRVLFRVRVDDVNCAMKLLRRRVWPRVRPTLSRGALFNLELFYRLKGAGCHWRQVDVEHYPRAVGSQTGARPSVVLRAAWEVIVLRLRLGRAPERRSAARRAANQATVA